MKKKNITKMMATALALVMTLSSPALVSLAEETDASEMAVESVGTETEMEVGEGTFVVNEETDAAEDYATEADQSDTPAVIELHNPIFEADASMASEQKITYDCIYFGSYPQTELVLTGSAAATKLATMNKTFPTDYVALSSTEFSKIISAKYDSNGDATVALATGEIKVRRITQANATCYDSGSAFYQWADSSSYHYFRYDPIKWRVLSADGSSALILADKVLDDKKYNTTRMEITWENSTLRTWLNSTFYNSAFSTEEKVAIKTTTVVNKNNLAYGTAGGNNTSDKLYLLSESEVYSTDVAASYGFAKSSAIYDEARRRQPTTFAFAMGAHRDVTTAYKGNSYWWLRSPGRDTKNAAYVSSDGIVHRDGDSVDYNYNGRGICPALNLNLSSLNENDYAGTVCTDGTVKEVCPHLYAVVSTVEAACGVEGYILKKCSKCGDEIKEKTADALEHNKVKNETESKPSTCTVKGKDVYSCSICKVVLETNELSLLEHTKIVDDEKSTPATCTSNGKNVFKCEQCGTALGEETVIALGHNKVKNLTESIASTCTSKGHEVYSCSRCKEVLETTETDALGHVKVVDTNNSYAATCTRAGITIFECSRCKEVLGHVELPMSLHEWEKTFTTDLVANCVEEGKKSIHCKNCDETKSDVIIPALGHKYGEWKTIVEPGATTEGESQRVCEICGNVEKQILPAKVSSGSGIVFNEGKGLVYTGYKIAPVVDVYRDGKLLRPGLDYTIKFSNNQNASTEKQQGKYTITYKGDYKSVKKEVKTFEIAKANMEDTIVTCGDMSTYSKPGMFKAKVYVDLNGFMLKASDYTVSYWLDAECTISMDSKHPLTMDEGKDYATGYVKVTGKGKNIIDSKVAAFKVYKKVDKGASITDISKCKLVLDAATKKGVAYNGEEQKPVVAVMNGKEPVIDGYNISYAGNVMPGTATIIVSGDGVKAVGSKAITFKIK